MRWLRHAVNLTIIRRPAATPIWQLEQRMRCKPCSEQRGYPFKRGHEALGPTRTAAPFYRPLSQHDKGTGAVHQCERNDGLEHRRRQVGSGISF